MNRIVIVILLSFTLIGCTKTDIITIDVNPEKSRVVELNDLYSDPVFIRLETTDEFLIHDVTKFEIFNDRIYIHDEMFFGFLYCFDMQGKFLYKIVNHGDGAGENMAGFTIDRENGFLWITDDYQRISKYDLNGNFINEYRVEFSMRDVSVIPNAPDLFAFQIGYHAGKNYGFAIYSLKDNKYVDFRNYYTEFERWLSGRSLSSSQNNLICGFGFVDTIFTVDSLGFRPQYALNFGKHKVPDQVLFDQNHDRLNNTFLDPQKEYAGRISCVIETDDYLKFIYFFGGKRVLSFYSKTRNKLINISKVLLDNKKFELKNFFEVSENEQFYSVLYSENICGNKVNPDTTIKNQDTKGYGVYKDINQLKSVIKDGDNPIIMFGKGNVDQLFEKL